MRRSSIACGLSWVLLFCIGSEGAIADGPPNGAKRAGIRLASRFRGPSVVQITGKEALRFAFIGEQRGDTSCGLAALAALIGIYRGEAMDELRLAGLASELAGADEGGVPLDLSLLLTLARRLGFPAEAFRLDYPRLREAAALYAPILVHYDRPRGHFALVLSAGRDLVVAADPARGLEALSARRFMARWSGAVLVVAKRPGVDGGLEETLRGALRDALGFVLGRAARLRSGTARIAGPGAVRW